MPTQPTKRYISIYLGTGDYAAGLLELINQARAINSESLSSFLSTAALERAQKLLNIK